MKVNFPSKAIRPASRNLPRGGTAPMPTGFGLLAPDRLRRLVIPILSDGPKIRYGLGAA